MLNLIPEYGKGKTISPHQALTGVQISAKHLCLGFGDRCMINKNADRSNDLSPRVWDGIALYPANDTASKWVFLVQEPGITKPKKVTRAVRDARVVPFTDDSIQHINSYVASQPHRLSINKTQWRLNDTILVEGDDVAADVSADVNTGGDAPPVPRKRVRPQERDDPPNSLSEVGPDGQDRDNEGAFVRSSPQNEQERQHLNHPEQERIPQSPFVPADDIRPPAMQNPFDGYSPEYDMTAESATELPETGYGMRTRSVTKRLLEEAEELENAKRFRINAAGNISMKKAVKLQEKGDDRAMKSAYKEVKQVVDFNVIEGVMPRDPTMVQKLKNKKASIIRSHLFAKEKRSGDYKGRLVGGGNRQDRSIYSASQITSPTVSLQSVLTTAAIAATENRDVMCIDVVGAYLHCDLEEDVYMVLEPIVARILCEIEPEYEPFKDSKGQIIVKLKKALYGLVESARLFYNHLSKTIEGLGFTRNPYDICVFNRTIDGKQQTVCFYVDDLFCTCADPALNDRLRDELDAIYPNLKVHRGDKHDYLGMEMTFDRVKKTVDISMSKYVKELVTAHPPTVSKKKKNPPSSPSNDDLFAIDEGSPLLPSGEAGTFHTVVAKCLYLSQRRSDISTTVAFLCTRVQAPTAEDSTKLNRLLHYLSGTTGYVMKLSAKDMRVKAYIDAAYGVHMDGKSHTGVWIRIGHGAIFASSTKQKIVTKSSTEAELVGVSDALSQVLWTRHFLEAQGYPQEPAIIYQDNTSTIRLARHGRTNHSRMRHVHIRYFFITDRIATGDCVVEYLPTADMLADMLTKPLTGSKFTSFRDVLLRKRD
jgi:hypothetical protein